ncbi:transmembrane emp24 domain-containing protein 5 isoform X2 [Buteo buteo]|uniref:transmembrane emp24 domain-containing protein 5 isoform X2 n=1 Tax=Buteo buteo TaxID=30397 RepID=UPI003EBBE885
MGPLPWPRPRPLLLLLPLGCFALLLPPPAATEFSPSLDSDFTFTLPAGRKECFYQPMRKEASLELEYQVLDGARLDVDFHLLSPKGETLVFDERKSDGVHTVETEDGDYMFCFDNTFSTVSEKVIFFELILDNMGEDGQDQEDWKKYVTGTDLLDMKLEDILDDSTRLGRKKQAEVPSGQTNKNSHSKASALTSEPLWGSFSLEKRNHAKLKAMFVQVCKILKPELCL